MTKEMIIKKLEELYWERAEVKEGGKRPTAIYPKKEVWINGEMIKMYEVEWFIADDNAIWNIRSMDEIEKDAEYLIRVHLNRNNEEPYQNWLIVEIWDIEGGEDNEKV